ncbi:MAG: branched-chain amino acid ABC transporter permease [Thermodesulfobacteriota bacterium]
MFFQQLINGLVAGCAYALVALGYTMIFGILGIVNFAQGEIYMFGAFSAIYTLAATGNIWLAAAAGMAAACLVGLLLERIAFRPLRETHPLIPLISAIGASIFLSSLARLLFGPEDRAFPHEFHPVSYEFGGIAINQIQIFIVAASIALMTILSLFLYFTRHGKAIMAVAMDSDAARLSGINVNRAYEITFVLGSALSGASGIMMAVYYNATSPTMGLLPGLKAFSAAILGGVGSIPGAIVGALVLGVAENLGAAYISSSFKDAFAFIALVLVLILRPRGIMGSRK